ncbi:hypothetical protein BDR26DRAFT_967778 [Obelidium mucronatum]|nr:hypothetical protein BDR26DRAFT_967778 [Obelidium mucronatum]
MASNSTLVQASNGVLVANDQLDVYEYLLNVSQDFPPTNTTPILLPSPPILPKYGNSNDNIPKVKRLPALLTPTVSTQAQQESHSPNQQQRQQPQQLLQSNKPYCYNCKTTQSYVWRRNDQGRVLCNTCYRIYADKKAKAEYQASMRDD